jgi:hypothetical protein
MFTHSRIDADYRTPLPGASVGIRHTEATAPNPDPATPPATPAEWVERTSFADDGCLRVVCILIDHIDGLNWGGSAGNRLIAEKAGRSIRWAGMHRAHLIRDGYVRWGSESVSHHKGRPPRRLPDRFILLSGLSSVEAPPPGKSMTEDVAHELLALVQWWPRTPKSRTHRAARMVAVHLQNGWTVEALLDRISRPQNEAVLSPYGLLVSLLPRPGTPYIVPAAHLAAGKHGRLLPQCRRCERVYIDRSITPGALCRDCWADDQPAPAVAAF